MGRVFAGALAMLASSALFASTASAVSVSWDVNPAQSSFKLTVPDQTVTLGTITATMRLRNQNNATWTQNNAPVDGLLATDVALSGLTPTGIQFLGGASSLVGVDTGSYRPNPAAYATNVTDTLNTAGTFTNTTSGSQVYAARVNASVSIITLNTGYIAFDNMQFDVASLMTAITGTSFITTALQVGIQDSQINFDGINTIAGQVVPDTQAQSGPILATNTGGPAGSIVNLGGNDFRLTVPFNLPVQISLGGVNLNATATGTLVGYATIVPEPATLALTGLGVAAIASYARRRRQG